MRALLAALAFAGTAAAAGPGIDVDSQELHYDVSGATAAEILDELRRQAGTVGEKHFAKAHWSVTWRYDTYQATRGACWVRNLRVQLVQRTVLPRWRDPPAALAARWRAFLDAVVVHERGHQRHGERAAAEVRQALAEARARNCGELERQANATADAIVKRHADLDAAYDASTGHGLKQGAYWDGSP